MAVDITLPIKLVSLANAREHWAVRAKRAKAHRAAAIVVPRHPLPCIVTITRHGRKRLDGDNLAISGKSLRDGIADRLQCDDGDPRIEWRYEQRIDKEYFVRVQIEAA